MLKATSQVGQALLPVLLASSGVAATRTSVNGAGDTTFQALATITIPANAMGLNGLLEIDCAWSYTNSATAKNLRIRFGGTDYHTQSPTTSVSYRQLVALQNRNNASSQVGSNSSGIANPYNVSTNAIVTSAVDTTADVTVQIGGDFGAPVAANTITLERYSVRLTRVS
jgi:hypothetical protein